MDVDVAVGVVVLLISIFVLVVVLKAGFVLLKFGTVVVLFLSAPRVLSITTLCVLEGCFALMVVWGFVGTVVVGML